MRWYLRYSLGYRDLEEIMLERGLQVDHTTIYRWVQRYAPELEKRTRPHLKAYNDSWRVDETYIKIKKTWMYLYRAVDSGGQTLEFLLSPARDAEAATHFFRKALHISTSSTLYTRSHQEQIVPPTALADPRTLTTLLPRVINVDKNAAYPKAIAELKASGILPASVKLRQVKYLNNLIEQDHRFIKRLTKPGMGFFSLETTWRTLQGFEIMNMLRKGQVQGMKKGDVRGQVALVATLYGILAQEAVEWLKANFFKTELELGRCLRLPEEGPWECDLYLTCSKFVTTPAYAPRLRRRRRIERALMEEAQEKGWVREVERHQCTIQRLEKLLTDLTEPLEGPEAID
ncbi:hypothetical protein KSF_102280 [Reticulibacter mediterranei]|uniref:Integrase catalytic domain-containing protein n=1 Tax=Reticulibacter mediterranei TaxID=2778369 RepID=A0A8J3N938_9CHLR|nr:hypothetical protein KSF_102280 [Reticulibacter mediterranei]